MNPSYSWRSSESRRLRLSLAEVVFIQMSSRQQARRPSLQGVLALPKKRVYWCGGTELESTWSVVESQLPGHSAPSMRLTRLAKGRFQAQRG